MKKRDFFAAAAAAAAAGALIAHARAAPAKAAAVQGPVLLTVTGRIGKSNRGPLDPVADQMMAKQKLAFASAFVFDAAALQRLPPVTISPTLEYDSRRHILRGPLLESVLAAADAAPDALNIGLRAIDGYNLVISRADARAWRMVVATHMDAKPLAVGGLGPQWAVYDADSIPAFQDKPVRERFAVCPWGLYHIDVRA